MANAGRSADSEILRRFLIHPLDSHCQRVLVEMCVRLTTGYLRYFQAKGWSLPMAHQTSGNPLRDLAIDIVGSLLASKRGRPYHKLFDFFHGRGITDFTNADASELYDAFRSLLYRFTRQERYKLMDDEDPQKGNLKRAFRDTLNAEEYRTLPGDRDAFVYAARCEKSLRKDQRAITFDELLYLVEEAFLHSNSRRQWCRAIFEWLNGDQSVRNFVERHQLLRAVVIVNLRYVDAEAFTPASIPDAEHGLVSGAVKRARTETLSWARQGVLDGFVGKARLTDEYAGRLLVACENYLVDLAHSSGTDPLPVYFREAMPDSEHRRYLKDFKHIFETLIHQARADFEERLRKFL